MLLLLHGLRTPAPSNMQANGGAPQKECCCCSQPQTAQASRLRLPPWHRPANHATRTAKASLLHYPTAAAPLTHPSPGGPARRRMRWAARPAPPGCQCCCRCRARPRCPHRAVFINKGQLEGGRVAGEEVRSLMGHPKQQGSGSKAAPALTCADHQRPLSHIRMLLLLLLLARRVRHASASTVRQRKAAPTLQYNPAPPRPSPHRQQLQILEVDVGGGSIGGAVGGCRPVKVLLLCGGQRLDGHPGCGQGRREEMQAGKSSIHMGRTVAAALERVHISHRSPHMSAGNAHS